MNSDPAEAEPTEAEPLFDRVLASLPAKVRARVNRIQFRYSSTGRQLKPKKSDLPLVTYGAVADRAFRGDYAPHTSAPGARAKLVLRGKPAQWGRVAKFATWAMGEHQGFAQARRAPDGSVHVQAGIGHMVVTCTVPASMIKATDLPAVWWRVRDNSAFSNDGFNASTGDGGSAKQGLEDLQLVPGDGVTLSTREDLRLVNTALSLAARSDRSPLVITMEPRGDLTDLTDLTVSDPAAGVSDALGVFDSMTAAMDPWEAAPVEGLFKSDRDFANVARPGLVRLLKLFTASDLPVTFTLLRIRQIDPVLSVILSTGDLNDNRPVYVAPARDGAIGVVAILVGLKD